MSPDIERFFDYPQLMQAAAERFADLAAAAIAQQGRFDVALSGGSTPAGLYRHLAAEPFASAVDWRHVHVFWGDERCVAPDHPDSNYRMVDEALLQAVPIPAANIHRMRGEIAPEQAAAEYAQQLRALLPHPPRFDLVLLGMGADGHTASLFPDSRAVRQAVRGSQQRWVAAEPAAEDRIGRLTLTSLVFNASCRVIFLVSGEEKAVALQAVLQGPYQPQVLPAQLIAPLRGRLTWMVDSAAAQRLQP